VVEGGVFARILCNCDGSFDVVFTLPDGSERRYGSVFCNRECAVSFAERINRLGVSAEHIEDLLEDALP